MPIHSASPTIDFLVLQNSCVSQASLVCVEFSMNQKKTKRQLIHRVVVGALRETIRIHGQINKLLIGSAAKRITGTLLANEEKEKKDESLYSDAE